MRKLNEHHPNLLPLAGLLALTLAMFGDILFAGRTRVLGHQGADLLLQYYSWRDFGFRELANGHLALWNPYIFGGAPYFGGMQSALFYPPNWLFLILPMAVAINWTIAFNTFALGAFMFFWMRVRGLSAIASFFAGTIAMFCGPYFSHVFAGHLPQMAAMTWSPLIFCAIDGLFQTRKVGWSLLGMFAVAMQILAGFPQYVFYTGIIAGLYSALTLIQERNWRLAPALLAIYVGGAALTAAQLFPAIEATGETVRSVRVSFEFASQCSFPPENFITLIAPSFFGGPANYWGRCYLWEASFFLGVTTLALATYGTIYLDRKTKWIPAFVIVVALLFGLGVHTPLFAFLYRYAPGFDRFRVTARFIFPASLFLILLAAHGFDRLLNRPNVDRKFVAGMFLGAGILALASVWVARNNSWQSLLASMQATHETYLRPDLFANPEFIANAQQHASSMMIVAAAITGVLAILLFFRDVRSLWVIVVLGVVETFWFARVARPTFDSATIINPQEKSFLADHPGDYRIINPLNPNSAMSLRVPDIWGYDPNVVRRYAEFITWTQGGDPDNATLYVKFTRFDPLYAMLRLRYVFAQRGEEMQSAEAPLTPMSHLQLVSNYRVIQNRDAIFAAMRSNNFDPTREVILEREPETKPAPNENPGTAKIVDQSTDALTIEADITRPSILLITDVYTPSWRVVPLSGSVQSKYELMPANYVLRGVPLAAGHHHFRVQYAPPEVVIGEWVSIVSVVCFVGAAIWCRRRDNCR